MATTVVIRLSALGDVAIAIPVLYSVAKKYPDEHFLLLTHAAWQSLFVDQPSNLTVFPVYTKGKHKGLWGMIRLLRELSSHIGSKNMKVADLHGVIRSFFIGCYFRIRGIPVAVIDKGRKEKQQLVRKQNKVLQPLKTSIDRYREVFAKLGFFPSLSFNGLFAKESKDKTIRIGIAPFAKHKGKIYPLEQMEEVVRRLCELPNTQILLFGSKEENNKLKIWVEKYPSVTSVTAAGQMAFNEELRVMNQLDVMVSMDSANMHLASLIHTPVVSSWGATHPYAGFYGYNQEESNAVQVDMPCRPCSVFGNKPCHRGDYACLKQITPEMIVEKMNKFVK
jgi:ADP-heptose:LPS heptosyltransferase